ncbi:MAG: polymerase factor sigma-70 [Ilumatobacteraceae bacterium]|nr:polymerase factor sigma-70 [Ilumatobacteraceae bacterium]
MTPVDADADAAFVAATDPFRPELRAYCYRMLGSMHDADDLVQDVYVRAWRAFDWFEGRSSVRLWLYTIATRVCLTALERRARRPLPSGLGAPSDDHRVAVTPGDPTMPWLQPAPDFGATGDWRDPAIVAASRAGVRLAFVAALQHLTARQRAVLVLRDVLAWPAAQVAEMLGSSTIAVNSALLRGRARLDAAGLVDDDLAEPDDVLLRAAVDRFAAAFEQADIDGLVALLRADVELEMPPTPTWFTGREAVVGFLGAPVLRAPGRWVLIPIRANAQPACVVYTRAEGDGYRAYGIQVLTYIGERVSRIVSFNDPSLPPVFGFPELIADRAAVRTQGGS